MTTIHPELPGEDIAPSVTTLESSSTVAARPRPPEASVNDFVKTLTIAGGAPATVADGDADDGTRSAEAIVQLQRDAIVRELMQLREALEAKESRIAELQKSIAQLEAPPAHSSGTHHRPRSAMSARVGADDQTSRRRGAVDAAIHATATGQRRDLLSYLRLRRRKA